MIFPVCGTWKDFWFWFWNLTDPSPLLPDAWGGGVLCFCASDAGVPPEGAVQTKHGRAGTLHLPVWISAAGKEEAVQSVNEDEACSVRIIHRGAANHLFTCLAHMSLDCIVFIWILWSSSFHWFQEQLPELNVHFRSQSFHTSMYASSWFLTLFLTFLPLPVATRIFDIFMYEVGNTQIAHTSCFFKCIWCV